MQFKIATKCVTYLNVKYNFLTKNALWKNFKRKWENIMKSFKKWIKAAGVRAIKTVAQTAVGIIGASAIISEVDWKVVLSASLLAGITSLLTSIAGLPEIKED